MSKAGSLTRDRPSPAQVRMGEPRRKVDGADPSARLPEPLADRPLTDPHPDRLAPDDAAFAEIIRAHGEALAAGDETYVDPGSGFTVLTAAYLARRGRCCGSGCRHCPYVT